MGLSQLAPVDKNGALCSYSARGSEINLVAPSGALDYTGDIRTLDLMGSAGLLPEIISLLLEEPQRVALKFQALQHSYYLLIQN